MTKENSGPLTGVRVLDISTVLAAPFAATLLGDFGAEIIKVELPGVGDSLRGLGPYKENEPLRWPGMARNKKSITLDIRTTEGKEIFKELVKNTDILIENFRPGTLEKWGLGYDVLSEVNENIIMARQSGYGQYGPYAEKAGFGTPSTAFSGYTYLQGFKDRHPVSPSFSLLDYISGTFLALGVVSAIYYRDTENSEGQIIDLGLYEGMFRMMEFLIAEYDQLGKVRERSPMLHGHSSPAGIYQTADDQWLVMVCSTQKTWERLAKSMGQEKLISDKRYLTNKERMENDEDLQSLVKEFFNKYSKEELMDILNDYGVPVSPVLSIKDIFEDPHYLERENIIEIKHPRLDKIKVPGIVPKFSKTPGKIRNIAPDLGEHNNDIYSEILGFSEKKIKSLKEKGVI